MTRLRTRSGRVTSPPHATCHSVPGAQSWASPYGSPFAPRSLRDDAILLLQHQNARSADRVYPIDIIILKRSLVLEEFAFCSIEGFFWTDKCIRLFGDTFHSNLDTPHPALETSEAWCSLALEIQVCGYCTSFFNAPVHDFCQMWISITLLVFLLLSLLVFLLLWTQSSSLTGFRSDEINEHNVKFLVQHMMAQQMTLQANNNNNSRFYEDSRKQPSWTYNVHDDSSRKS